LGSGARNQLAACGITSAAFAIGGATGTNVAVNRSDIFNGTAWATTTALNVTRFGLSGCGTTSNALSFGGYISTGTSYATTEI